MRALVIGADGFAGRWLVRHLVESGDQVWAAGGPRFVPPLEDAVESVSLDVRDADAVTSYVRKSAPQAIYFLAGVSTYALRDDPELAIGISVNGAMNVLLGCVGLPAPPRLLYVSTAYVYGSGSEPLTESSPERPTDVYPAAKLAGERALGSLAPVIGVDVVVARPFNHIGPGQRESFLVPTIARQIAAGGGRVSLRSTTTVRDFTDVRDVVRAYRLLVDRGKAGSVYNIASGSGMSTTELVDAMAAVAGVRVRLDATDPTSGVGDRMVGDAGRLRDLGWSPRHALDHTLREVLAEWATRVP